MNLDPLISVIIPVFNGEVYLNACIKNMLRQSYKNLEIIIVDDGSTDLSAEIAKKYPVKLLQIKENRGLSAARNMGMDSSKGGYIHFMDVDDEINDHFYENLIEAIVITGADIACAGMVNEKKPHRTILFEKQRTLYSVTEKLKVTNVGKWGYVWRFLFKKSFLKKNNFRFEEGRFIEDLPVTLPAVFYSDKLVVVPHTRYLYKSQEGSIMNNSEKNHKKKRRRDLQYVKKFRHDFASKHRIRIPGIPTGNKLAYYFVRWLK